MTLEEVHAYLRDGSLVVLLLFGYCALSRLGHHLIDYWFARWEQREADRDWSRRYGKGPHGD